MSPTSTTTSKPACANCSSVRPNRCPSTPAAWDDPPMATVVAIREPRRSRSALAAIVATAAAVALVVGVAADRSRPRCPRLPATRVADVPVTSRPSR